MDGEKTEICQEWILRTPSGCLSTSLQFAAFVLGVLSIIAAWVPAHIIILRGKRKKNNKKLKDVVATLHSGLANGLNLSGAILAKQLATQVLQAVYLIAIDAMFLILYCCFINYSHSLKGIDKKKKKRKKKRKRASGDELTATLANSGASTSLMCLCLSCVLSAGYLWTQSSFSLWSLTLHHESVKTNGRTLLGFLEVTTNEKIGYALGVLALICSWTCKIPVILQVYKNQSNYRQKTVCCLLILGNLTYSLAIAGQLGDTALIHALPWILNSMGLVGLDLGILLQLLINKCSRRTVSRGHGSLLESDGDQLIPNHDGWLPLTKLEDEENVEELVDIHGKNHSEQFEEIKILESEDEHVHFSQNISPTDPPRVVIKSSATHSGSSESGCDADTELEWEDFNEAENKKKKLLKAKNGQTQEKHKLLKNR